MNLPSISELIRNLLTENHELSQLFFENIRAINLALAMTSQDTDAHSIWEKNAPATFKIHGHLRHYVDTVVPRNESDPNSYTFSQIYLLDPETQLDRRSQLNGLKDPKVIKLVETLQNALMTENVLIKQFKTCYEIAQEEPELENYEIIITDENIETGAHKLRGVRIKRRKPIEEANLYTKIPEDFGLYDALSYPILIPKAEQTWSHQGIKRVVQHKRKSYVTAREYYCYLLQQRVGVFNQFFHGRRLFQQYLLDMWAKIHQYELKWITQNQKTIRAELYQGIVDAAETNDLENVGQKVILPSAHTASPRWYFERYQEFVYHIYLQ